MLCSMHPMVCTRMWAHTAGGYGCRKGRNVHTCASTALPLFRAEHKPSIMTQIGSSHRLFLPFLPQDNASIPDGGTEAAISSANAELGRLLQLPASGFWEAVRSTSDTSSLVTFLDSYLRFKRCSRHA